MEIEYAPRFSKQMKSPNAKLPGHTLSGIVIFEKCVVSNNRILNADYLGDVGFAGYWTLELFCIQPMRIYAGVQIAQIYYHTISEPYERYERGKYQNNSGIQASKLYEEFLL